MPPSKTIHLRAFELRAGPKTARLVTVSVDKSIADVYAHLRSVLKLDASLSGVTFHKTHDKKIDTAPLSVTAPIGTLGLAENDIFIIRQGGRARSIARDVATTAEEMNKEPDLNLQKKEHGQPIALSCQSASSPDHITSAKSTPAPEQRETEANGVSTNCASAAAGLSYVVGMQRGIVCLSTDAHCHERYRQQFMQHRHLTQVCTLKACQLLVLLSRTDSIVSPSAPQQGVTQLTEATTVKDLHRELLFDFSRRASLPLRHVDHLLKDDIRGMASVYEALYYYADVPTPGSDMLAKVEKFLSERLPQLCTAAKMICLLHAGREAEYLEGALLRLIGRAPTSMSWLCLRNVARFEQREEQCCYFSTITKLSQSYPPIHVAAAQIPVLEVSELDSCCVAWGLNNTAYRGHLLPLSCWTWSRLVAAITTSGDDTCAHLCELLNTYSEYEASLNWVG